MLYNQPYTVKEQLKENGQRISYLVLLEKNKYKHWKDIGHILILHMSWPSYVLKWQNLRKGKQHLLLEVFTRGDLNSGTDLCWQIQAESANPSVTGPTRHLSIQGGWQQFHSQCWRWSSTLSHQGAATAPAPGHGSGQYLAAVSSAAPTGTAFPRAADTAKECSQGSRGEANWLSSPGPGGLWREKTERKAALDVWVIRECCLPVWIPGLEHEWANLCVRERRESWHF